MEVLHYLADLGEGGYATVWLCRDAATNELRAVKGFKTAHKDLDVMRMVTREVKTLQKVSHPNVVQFKSAFRSKSGRVYVVLEYVGVSMHRALQCFAGGVPSPLLKSVAWQLMQAVKHLHGMQVMHRDIKPANVLLGSDGVVKLCDFGLACSTRCSPREAEEGTPYVVTRWYRPPEVLVGDAYGPAADIWSLGCTLAEIATGRPLFPGRSSADQLFRIMRCLGPLTDEQAERACMHERLGPELGTALICTPPQYKTLRQRLPEIQPRLFELVQACLQVDPALRCTADELMGLPYLWDTPEAMAAAMAFAAGVNSACAPKQRLARASTRERAKPGQDACEARAQEAAAGGISAMQVAAALRSGQHDGTAPAPSIVTDGALCAASSGAVPFPSAAQVPLLDVLADDGRGTCDAVAGPALPAFDGACPVAASAPAGAVPAHARPASRGELREAPSVKQVSADFASMQTSHYGNEHPYNSFMSSSLSALNASFFADSIASGAGDICLRQSASKSAGGAAAAKRPALCDSAATMEETLTAPAGGRQDPFKARPLAGHGFTRAALTVLPQPTRTTESCFAEPQQPAAYGLEAGADAAGAHDAKCPSQAPAKPRSGARKLVDAVKRAVLGKKRP